MSENEENEKPEAEENENPAVDGLLHELARTGGPEDDETFIKSLKRRISRKDPTAGREADWPWVFSARFWQVAAGIAVLFIAWFGFRTYQIKMAYPDPTEVFFYTQPRIEAGEPVAVRAFVREARFYRPTPDAKVVLLFEREGERRRIAEEVTDENGICQLTAELPENLAPGDYQLRVEVDGPEGEAEAEQTVSVVRSFRTMLSTDKPLYQPGQTIHMKAISLENDTLLPVAGRDVVFEIRDAKGNKVFRDEVETSDFGIAAADFELASQVNEGSYTIAVTVGDTTSEREVIVETYTLPRFKIGLETNRNFYSIRDTIEIDLDANYTFGKPVANADVVIHAERFLADWDEFAELKGQTNAAGKISFELPLKSNYFTGQELHLGDAEIRLRAVVTDAVGEKRQLLRHVKLTIRPLRVEIFPESGELVQGVQNRLYFVATYADGSPAQARIVTKGAGIAETNELGIASVPFRANKLTTTIEFEAQTNDGARLRAIRPLKLGKTREGILLRTDRAAYRQGETAQLTFLSALPKRKVFLDVVKDGRSFATASIDIVNSRGDYALDLPLDIAGTVQLQAYAILKSGQIVRDTRLIQVHRAEQLLVEAKLDAETYRPAATAMIEFLVKSKNGDPVEAALSLAAVDEAVFALNDVRPGLEEMAFLIQEELLKPRYQFTTEPLADFTIAPEELDENSGEANVVGFAAAVGSDAVPSQAQGESIHDRWDQVKQDKVDHRLRTIRLLAWIPFACLIPIFILLAAYTISRVGFQTQGTDEKLQADAFRAQLLMMFWILLVSILLFPALTLFSASATTVIVFFFLFVGPTVWLTVVAGEICRLPFVERKFLLFVRMIRLIPATYALSAAVVLGMTLAQAIDPDSISDVQAGFFKIVSLAAVVFSLAFLVFLRGTLGTPRPVSDNTRRLAIHLSAAAIGALVFVISANACERFLTSIMRSSVKAEFDMVMEGNMAPNSAPPSMAMPTLAAAAAPGEAPRVRRNFPETLLWRPQLVTDENGRAKLEVELADSITTWRLSGSAVTRGGRMSSFQQGIRVFQDFFIDIDFPTELTQNDEIAAPIAIFNYLDQPQTIQLRADPADWFEFVGDSTERTIELGAGEITTTSFRIRALQPGRHSLTVSARGTSLSDAIERSVQVKPDGKRIEQVVNGQLSGETISAELRIPENAIEGGSDLFLKIYPGAFSQVVEGMDSIFRMPSGCFEQTSSTTYPNVLVLDYLRKTKQTKPEIELKALGFIAQGYQRLLSYEVDGGGFEWFGNPPAHPVLTAYGLMEFVDMAEVYEVDPAVIRRTRDWLLSRRQRDGSFGPSAGGIAEGAINQFQGNQKVRTTAYIAWAISEAGGGDRLKTTFDFLIREADGAGDAYTLGLCANAFAAAGRDRDAREFLKQLSKIAESDDARAFWKAEGTGATFSMGDTLSIETTAIVAQAMLRAKHEIGTARRALAWLIEQRDGNGTWRSTQATVHAMRALLLGAESGGSIKGEIEVAIAANGGEIEPLRINSENADVFHLISLTENVKSGSNQIDLTPSSDANLAWQLVSIHHEPWTDENPQPEKILEIETEYSTTKLETNDLLTVEVTLRHNRPWPAPMTLVDLGIPPGFAIESSSFQQLLEDGVIQRFEPKGAQVSLYFGRIPGNGEPLKFEYALRAKFPISAKTPPSEAWQYYEPEVRDETESILLEVQ